MISQVNGSAVRGAYTNDLGEAKETVKKGSASITGQGDMSKVEQIKEALESGEYKINLEALSEKIADELL